MTEEEFVELDDAEETDLEFADGFATEKAVVDRNHANLVGELGGHFFLHRRRKGGEFGPERRVRVRPGRRIKPDNAYYVRGAPMGEDVLPTIAVEVRSKSQTMAEQRRKCHEYVDAGVPEVWLIDPVSRSVEVFLGTHVAQSLRAPETLTSRHLPGFALALAELFSVLD